MICFLEELLLLLPLPVAVLLPVEDAELWEEDDLVLLKDED
jgi:hypothetical protein